MLPPLKTTQAAPLGTHAAVETLARPNDSRCAANSAAILLVARPTTVCGTSRIEARFAKAALHCANGSDRPPNARAGTCLGCGIVFPKKSRTGGVASGASILCAACVCVGAEDGCAALVCVWLPGAVAHAAGHRSAPRRPFSASEPRRRPGESRLPATARESAEARPPKVERSRPLGPTNAPRSRHSACHQRRRVSCCQISSEIIHSAPRGLFLLFCISPVLCVLAPRLNKVHCSESALPL